MALSDSVPALTFLPVTEERWQDFDQLFSAPGGPKHCWCMVWRRSSEEAKNQDGLFRKSLIRARVSSGEPIGILAYQDEKPVAWCSIAPRAAHRPTMAKVLGSDSNEVVWSLVCFFVVRRLRNQGVMRQLIEAAGHYARQSGATVIEAYPVEKDAPSYRFGGFVETFAAAGFTQIGEAGIRRKVYRKVL